MAPRVRPWIRRHITHRPRPEITKSNSVLPVPEAIPDALNPRNYYEYDILDEGEIRIIELEPGTFDDPIHCNLKRVKLDGALNTYEALSYVWGDPNDTASILCSKKWTKITKNLFGALKNLRYSDRTRLIWADALCINQADNTERSRQVLRMGEVYSNADQVLIWLGEETLEVQGALGNLETWLHYDSPHTQDWKAEVVTWTSEASFDIYPNYVSDEVALWLEYQQRVFPAIMHLFLRPWWSRRWVIQEVSKAQRAVFVCGQSTHVWTSIINDYDYLGALRGSLARLTVNWKPEAASGWRDKRTEFLKGIDNAYSLSRIVSELNRGRTDPSSKMSIEFMLSATPQFDCSDPRDRLYSILSLVEDTKHDPLNLLQIDYEASVATVCTRLSYHMLCNPLEKDPLTHFGTVLGERRRFDQKPRNGEQSTPSWACTHLISGLIDLRSDIDWSLNDLRFDAGRLYSCTRPHWKLLPTSSSDTTMLNCSSISSDNCVVSLRGAIFDEISEIEVETLEKTHFEKCSFSGLRVWAQKICRVIEREVQKDVIFEPLFEMITCGGEDSVKAMSRAMFLRYTLDLESARRWSDCLLQEDASEAQRTYRNGFSEFSVFYKVSYYARSRRLCSTSSGHVGWVPQVAEVGDNICVIPGYPHLLVISPCGEGYYNLIGQCYMQGLMSGGALDLGIEEEWINLY